MLRPSFGATRYGENGSTWLAEKHDVPQYSADIDDAGHQVQGWRLGPQAPGRRSDMAAASLSATVGKRTLRALFLADLGPIPAHVVWAWRERGYEIAEIWTKGGGRGAWKRERQLGWFAPHWSLAAAIDRWGIRHRSIDNLKAGSDAALAMASMNVDVIISVHFMRILPRTLLEQLSVPVFNLHPSLLPAYRGSAPLVGMLLDEMQDRFGGVTLHGIVPAIDAGPIFAARPVAFPLDHDTRSWELDLARAAASLAVENIPDVLAGRIKGVAQAEEKAGYRRVKADELTLNSQLTAARVAWLCASLGRMRPLTFAVGNRAYPVTRMSHRLGPPSGQDPRVTWLTIETDLADARVRLRRKPIWEGRRRRIETWFQRVLARP
jgi:methionyl-tRNA formyltransferase